jgi:hypothetical protein
VAYATIEFIVLCPERSERDRNLNTPAAADFTNPKHEPPRHDFGQVDEFIETEQVARTNLVCNQGRPLWIPFDFTYREYDARCSDYNNETKSFERRAKEYAKFLAEQTFFCPPPCNLHVRARALGSTCNFDEVTVRVHVEVDCS